MKQKLILLTLFSATIFIMATGCTHLVPVKVQPTTLRRGNKLPLHAVLVLNQELTDYHYQFHMMGDVWDYKFGPPLQDYARRIASDSFGQVDEASSVPAAFANQGADVVLIPRPVKAEESTGLTAQSKVFLTLVVEWVAKDRATQNTVWLKTITADAEEVQGNIFSGSKHRNILLQKLFDDLNRKTGDAFQNAPELRNLQH